MCAHGTPAVPVTQFLQRKVCATEIPDIEQAVQVLKLNVGFTLEV